MKALFVTRSIEYGQGGISQLSRMVDKVLSDLSREKVIDKHYTISLQSTVITDNVRSFDNNRILFILHYFKEVRKYDMVIFDQLGMARLLYFFRFSKKRKISFIHGIEVWETPFFAHLGVVPKLDLIISNSLYTKNRANRIHGIFSNTQVCWLSAEHNDIRSFNILKYDQTPKVLIVGRLHQGRDKGHRLLVDCWVDVVDKVPNAELRIVGRGNDYDLIQDYIKNSPVSGNIKLLGYLNESELEEEYKQTWVYAMPSLGEGFGYVYVEAMSYGVPVIASLQDAGHEINVHNVTGFNIDIDDSDEMTQKITMLLSDVSLNRKFSKKALDHYSNNFQFIHFKERLSNLILN